MPSKLENLPIADLMNFPRRPCVKFSVRFLRQSLRYTMARFLALEFRLSRVCFANLFNSLSDSGLWRGLKTRRLRRDAGTGSLLEIRYLALLIILISAHIFNTFFDLRDWWPLTANRSSAV